MSKGQHGEAGASAGARRAIGEASASRPLVGTGRWSGSDPIRWTVWLRWLSLSLFLFFTKTIMGVGAFSASTRTATFMSYAAARRTKAAGLTWPSIEWRRRWL